MPKASLLLTMAACLGITTWLGASEPVFEPVEIVTETPWTEETVPLSLPSPAAPPPKLWEGRAELGFNGSDGNSERFNTRIGLQGKRKGPRTTLALDLLYVKSTQNGTETENKAILKGRNEWLLKDSPWSLYVNGITEYDEFQAWDIRLTANGGLGYHWLKSDAATLATRLGAGASREIGGPDDETVPEANLGLDFEQKLTERQKVTATVELFPDITEPSDIRTMSKAAWEILVDPEWNLSLQLGILHRYDSTPQGAKSNDLDYYGTVAWSF